LFSKSLGCDSSHERGIALLSGGSDASAVKTLEAMLEGGIDGQPPATPEKKFLVNPAANF
jgi:hypothetical protein